MVEEFPSLRCERGFDDIPQQGKARVDIACSTKSLERMHTSNSGAPRRYEATTGFGWVSGSTSPSKYPKEVLHENVAYSNTGIPTEKRQDLARAFNQDVDGEGDLKSSLGNPRFLVSTTRLLSTGSTCTACSRVFIWEPDYVPTDGVHFKARVLRIVQTAAKTMLCRYITTNSKSEQAINDKATVKTKFGEISPGGVEVVELLNADDEREIEVWLVLNIWS